MSQGGKSPSVALMSRKESVYGVDKTNLGNMDKTMQNEQHIGSTVQKCY